MTYKMILALIAGSIITTASITSYAADTATSNDDNTVVGACMVQKFKENVPPIPQATIEKCAETSAGDTTKCLGLTEDDYMSYVKFCVAQLNNAKCVSEKMNKPLMDYANCGYEKDPVACFKGLGFTPDQIVKLSTDCQNQNTK